MICVAITCIRPIIFVLLKILNFLCEFSVDIIIEEAGWTPDQYGHSRFKTVNSLSDQKSLTAFMRSLLKVNLLVSFFCCLHIAWLNNYLNNFSGFDEHFDAIVFKSLERG